MLSSSSSFLLYPQGKTGEPGLPGPEGARGPPVSAERVCVCCPQWNKAISHLAVTPWVGSSEAAWPWIPEVPLC